jgi:hypothetical protein
MRQAIGNIENLMIRGLRSEAPFQFGMELLTFTLTMTLPSPSAILTPRTKRGSPINSSMARRNSRAWKLSDSFPFSEVIEFLDDRDGNNNIMLLELVNALAVVQSNIGVENEGLPAFHLTATTAVGIRYGPCSRMSRRKWMPDAQIHASVTRLLNDVRTIRCYSRRRRIRGGMNHNRVPLNSCRFSASISAAPPLR